MTPPVLDTADLTRRLRETEAELARVTLRLHRLENSTTVQLTRLVAAAVRNPRTGLPGLPRAVAGLLRRRRAARRPGATPAGSAAASPGPVGRGGPAVRPPGARGGPAPAGAADRAAPAGPAGDRLAAGLLAASALLVTTRDRPVLAVVADDAQARAWSEGAHVQRLRPDDAPAVLAAVTPDLLVIDAAAGRGGPWSGLGTYAVPERDRVVLDLLHAARARDIPAVLVAPRTQEEAPMLADARELFSGHAPHGAAVGDLVAAGQVAP